MRRFEIGDNLARVLVFVAFIVALLGIGLIAAAGCAAGQPRVAIVPPVPFVPATSQPASQPTGKMPMPHVNIPIAQQTGQVNTSAQTQFDTDTSITGLVLQAMPPADTWLVVLVLVFSHWRFLVRERPTPGTALPLTELKASKGNGN